MRRLRYRLTVRRMMIAVAIVAILLGLGVSAHRLQVQSRIFRDRASEYAEIELFSDPTHVFLPASVGRSEIRAARLRTKVTKEWARKLREKYTRAAHYPWITVEPDPPEPR